MLSKVTKKHRAKGPSGNTPAELGALGEVVRVARHAVKERALVRRRAKPVQDRLHDVRESELLGLLLLLLFESKQLKRRLVPGGLHLAVDLVARGCFDLRLLVQTLGVTVSHFLVNKITKLAKIDSLGHTI